MVVIDKVVKSAIAPTDGKVLWLNTADNITYHFTDSGWTPTSSNGGATGFFIGTQAERLALTPQNGYEFNQVEEDGTVHRYFYEQNEWVLLDNPDVHDTEEVIFNINSNDGLLILSSLTVEVENLNTGVTHEVEINSFGEGIIHIPIGEQYKITLPKIEHYSIDTYEFIYTADRHIVRTINVTYRHYDTLAASFIIEASADPTCETGGASYVLTRILEGRVDKNKPVSGTYVIDEANKKYAKLDPTNHAKFADGANYTGIYGNVFRYLPAIYIFHDTTYQGGGTKYYISDVNFTAAAHPIVLPESWIGVYKAHFDSTAGKIYSRPNLATSGNITISDFQAHAEQNGTDYGINDYKNWQKLCALFIAEFGTTNVDSTAAGAGMAESENAYYNIATGTTISLGDATGKVEYQDTGYYQCKLFGIEALWGQQWEFLKGIYFNGSIANVYDANSYTMAETPTRTFHRLIPEEGGGYITSLVKGDYFDILPSAAGNGTSASYYCDDYYGANGDNLLLVGGDSVIGFLPGLFCSGSAVVFSGSDAVFGARLCFYGDISQYELITGTEMVALHS